MSGAAAMRDPDVRQALEALADANGGRLTPEAVVNAARDPDNPLHPFFTWDDAAAAHARRVDEARALIRSVRVEISTETKVIVAPLFLRDPELASDVQGYRSLPRLRSDEDAARAVVIAEFARAEAALRRARSVAEALDVHEEINALVADLDALKVRLHDSIPGRLEAAS